MPLSPQHGHPDEMAKDLGNQPERRKTGQASAVLKAVGFGPP
jgi:hypothetical protein